MPLIEPSTFHAPWLLSNGHAQTILAAWLRKAPVITCTRERIETEDGDYLDLDWAAPGADRVAIVSYGMEGAPDRPYVRSMLSALHAAGWDAVVWNYRGASGTPNRKVHFYHGGLTGDLHAVIQRALQRGYRTLSLVGFSLGGNLLLNYLGQHGSDVPAGLQRAVAISAPVDVADCARQMRRFSNRLYSQLFLRSFRDKIRAKMQVMPDRISDTGYNDIRTLEQYDERYTVPHFGFKSVPDFYRFVSSRYRIENVRIPTLMISARNDPFMGPDCYPVDQARANPNLFLEMTRSGGHLGFLSHTCSAGDWLEKRTVAFLEGG